MLQAGKGTGGTTRCDSGAEQVGEVLTRALVANWPPVSDWITKSKKIRTSPTEKPNRTTHTGSHAYTRADFTETQTHMELNPLSSLSIMDSEDKVRAHGTV